jgi:ferredoxin
MGIKRVWLNETDDVCISCGVCETIAPDIFEVPDKMIVKENVDFNQHAPAIKEAAEECPTNVISLEEDDT